MRVYLDNCCYNRPFDEQSQLRIRLETEANHLSCAVEADCDWFFTVDKGILKKVSQIGNMRVANPIDYVKELS